MQIYLSTLTEVDYAETLNKIEEIYDAQAGVDGKAQRKLISNLRKAPTYNYELEVIAKNEDAAIIGHIMLSEVTLVAEEDSYKALEVVSLIVDPDVRNQGLGKALVQAIEERAKSQHYTTIIVSHSSDYFKQLSYELAEEHHIFPENADASTIRVKFLWNQLNDYPHGTVHRSSEEG